MVRLVLGPILAELEALRPDLRVDADLEKPTRSTLLGWVDTPTVQYNVDKPKDRQMLEDDLVRVFQPLFMALVPTFESASDVGEWYRHIANPFISSRLHQIKSDLCDGLMETARIVSTCVYRRGRPGKFAFGKGGPAICAARRIQRDFNRVFCSKNLDMLRKHATGKRAEFEAEHGGWRAHRGRGATVLVTKEEFQTVIGLMVGDLHYDIPVVLLPCTDRGTPPPGSTHPVADVLQSTTLCADTAGLALCTTGAGYACEFPCVEYLYPYDGVKPFHAVRIKPPYQKGADSAKWGRSMDTRLCAAFKAAVATGSRVLIVPMLGTRHPENGPVDTYVALCSKYFEKHQDDFDFMIMAVGGEPNDFVVGHHRLADRVQWIVGDVCKVPMVYLEDHCDESHYLCPNEAKQDGRCYDDYCPAMHAWLTTESGLDSTSDPE